MMVKFASAQLSGQQVKKESVQLLQNRKLATVSRITKTLSWSSGIKLVVYYTIAIGALHVCSNIENCFEKKKEGEDKM